LAASGFFNQRYNEIAEAIDKERIFSEEKRRGFFYKYEMFYNQLMSCPVFTTLSKDQVSERYLQFALHSFVALDIYKTFRPDNEHGFYYHLHHFLLSEHCSIPGDDEKDIFLGLEITCETVLMKLKLLTKELSNQFANV
jgi:hypothetical protein